MKIVTNKKRSNIDSPLDYDEFKQLNQIALYIKELRFCYGLKQKDLAEIAEVHFRTVQNIENGGLNYTIKNLIKVISAFDSDLGSLFIDTS
jgi:transcriptional regulator with XRE-family HTH domain